MKTVQIKSMKTNQIKINQIKIKQTIGIFISISLNEIGIFTSNVIKISKSKNDHILKVFISE